MANEPITREEILLNAVATGEVANLEPITREEMFLAKLGGADVPTPTPVTRKEQFLQKAIEGGSGGGSSGGDTSDISAEKYIEAQHAEVVLPNATAIKPYAFTNDRVLTSVAMPKVVHLRTRAFYSCSNLVLTSLPDGLKTIESYALASVKIANGMISIPAGVESIGEMVFQGSSSLEKVTFEGKPVSVNSSSFAGCANLTTVNVPWSEGEVANAPWGASKATINYNYTGE
jgi:hypothetical protein